MNLCQLVYNNKQAGTAIKKGDKMNMSKITISHTKDYFIKDNKPFFYLADTVWSAFTNIYTDEWDKYLEYRKMQGFNVLQINILPQWDASQINLGISPFEKNRAGEINYFKINEEYFSHACEMLYKAVQKGFTPAIVVLWCNYVPYTWLSKNRKQDIMPIEAIEPYCEYAAKLFKQFNPIFIVSGDTSFESERTAEYYLKALEVVKKNAEDCLCTMHIWGDSDYLPTEFEESIYLDFYMYQSGHAQKNQNVEPWKMAQTFMKKNIKRPIVNGEPCYEGMGFKSGRYNQLNIRQAIWQSLLSGAKAGITYGAHGVWCWHRSFSNFEAASNWNMPFYWDEALRLQGAWDASYARWIFENYDLFDIHPSEKIVNSETSLRMSATSNEDKIIIYTPYSIDVDVKADLDQYDIIGIILENKHIIRPCISKKDDIYTIQMPQFNSDILYIGQKKK